MNKKTVFAAIVGRPNVGKSSLTNAILGEKISIISKKPQTTRNKITGILTKGEWQYVFFDTPGLHLPKSLLGRYMEKSAKKTIGEVDLTVLMVEPVPKIGEPERDVLEKTKAIKTPVILAINKIDTIPKEKILEVIATYAAEYEFAAVVPVCAKSGEGVEPLLSELSKYLVESEFFFPEDMITDQPERKIASEIIREKALRLLDCEIPHGIGVSIEEFKEQKILSIRAEIFCERESHKSIIIGKSGAMIKKIGSYARQDLEAFFGIPIYLDLWVKVRQKWRDRPNMLNDLGYNEKDL
ncbi:MAG: GTPase Era [Oscillospiraceae bacterium]|nr:GTPase Era [Oscillospiraceae bacterium]